MKRFESKMGENSFFFVFPLREDSFKKGGEDFTNGVQTLVFQTNRLERLIGWEEDGRENMLGHVWKNTRFLSNR